MGSGKPPRQTPDAMIETMTQHPSPSRTKADNELLQKGILIALIGLAVLVAPHFMAASPVRDTVAASAVVGWFALVLGAAFIGLYLVRRRKAGPK